MKTAIYAGSFDPIHNGHIEIIKTASQLFDKLFVVIAVNSKKKTLFSDSQRLDMIKQSILDINNLDIANVDIPNVDIPNVDIPNVDIPNVDIPNVDIANVDIKNIEVVIYSGLVVDFAKEKKASVLIRGLRTSADFDYESQIATMNKKMSAVPTIFLAPDEKYSYLSSSLIREIAKYGQDCSEFVPQVVANSLKNIY